MKKCIAVLLTIALLMASLGCSFIVFAANSVSVDSFINSVEELNEEESDEEKTLEESAGSRVIVKSLQKPETYGNAEYIKGTYGKHIFQYATEEEALEAVEHYRSLSGIKYAVLDGIVKTQGVPYSEAMLGTQRAKEYIATQEITQEAVKVGVLDTGIEFTNELYEDNPRIIDSGVNMTDSGNKNSAYDDEGHGSIVAEIVMDNTPEAVNVVGYKVLNSNGSGTNLWVATGIEKAVENGVDIINLSLGGEAEPIGYESSIVLDDAVRFAIEQGVLVVVSSGNDGYNAKYFSPANVEGVVTVGAIDKAGNPAYFSNFGDCVDFVAPGVQIEHDFIKYIYDVYGDVTSCGYKEPVDGTSFSSPYVAATAATTLCVYPNLSSNQIKQKLKTSALTYEDLYYHDNLHPITEDQGVVYYKGIFFHREEDTSNKQIYYGNGMPQADLIVAFKNEAPRTETPHFSQKGGHYVDEEFDLTLSSEEGAEIYYTLDESYPTKENGIKYDGSIRIDELESVRAVAYCEGKAPSDFSAEVYRMEYHVPESEFTFKETRRYSQPGRDIITYKNVIMSYTGTKASIICPDTIEGKPVERFEIKADNTALRSLRLPETCTTFKYDSRYWSKLEKNGQRELRILNAPGLTSFNINGRYCPSLVEINAPKAKTVMADKSNIRSLYVPDAKVVQIADAHCLKEVYAPSLQYIQWQHIDPDTDKFVEGGTFRNCYSLETIYIPQIIGIGREGLFNCCKLKDFETNHLKYIADMAFHSTNSLTKLICPELVDIKGGNSFGGSGIDYLYAPKLERMSFPIGWMNGEYDDGQVLDCSYFTSKLVVSSKWVECERDAEGYDTDPFKNNMRYFYHHNLDIYGTPNTFAEEYANRFHLKFVPLPLLESEPDNMGYQSDGNITADILGFNKEYQWYGTNRKDNHGGVLLKGETSEDLDTSKYNFKYYYCKVKTSDGDYKKDIITGESNLNYYDLNNDGTVDIQDVSLILTEYGSKTRQETEIYDVNGDNIIDLSDISIILSGDIYSAVA